MADDFIGVDASGIPELTAKLAQLPDAVADDGVEAANDYLLNIMQTYNQYAYVPRSRVGWASEKQRRYVMMAISKGWITIPSPRSQTLRKGWKAVGSGKNQILVNETPYAGYVMGDEQARRFNLMSWDTVTERISDHLSNLIQKFDAGVAKAIKRLGL